MNSISLVLALVASHKYKVHHLYVRSAFLHGDLWEEIYMDQPPRYISNDFGVAFHLTKSLSRLNKPIGLGMLECIAFF